MTIRDPIRPNNLDTCNLRASSFGDARTPDSLILLANQNGLDKVKQGPYAIFTVINKLNHAGVSLPRTARLITASPGTQTRKQELKVNLELSSPAHGAAYVVKTRRFFSSETIPVDQPQSARLRTRLSVCGASVSPEVHLDAMIQPLRRRASRAPSRRRSSIFTCEQDLPTESNKWGASHLPLAFLFRLGDVIVGLWASWDPCFLHPWSPPPSLFPSLSY